MIGNPLRAIFGSKNDRELKRMGKLVARISSLEDEYTQLTDEQLKEKTIEFKQRYKDGQTLNQLLPEAFAVVREAGKRVMKMRHFDVQMIGGITLHEGRIAEMKTGEGKTLVATLPAYLNALSGKGVHIITVNDYLAERDGSWMTPLFDSLGLTVGIIKSGQANDEKQLAYRADITYGTNNEFGFDYLRDNMALRYEDKVQRDLNFAIVDEVDSILIDEARTPLVISGAAEDSSVLYTRMNKLIQGLHRHIEPAEGEPELEEPGHFTIDEKARTIEVTEAGHEQLEALMSKDGLLPEGESLYGANNLNLLHHVLAALRAHNLFQRDVDYIIQEGQVVLIDEHTGRTMAGRRLSEGLHQALEAKEGVQIQNESQTLASTTFQNYFRLYPTLSGMTGTADTEAFEFKQIYNLDVVVIPPNKTIQRKDLNDLIYMTTDDKYAAITRDVEEYQAQNVPVLVGTASVETSEEMSRRLKKAGIKHEVLNAKFHEREADIIAQAGRPGAVTIATNMAGRGTDIVLGGKWEADLAALKNPTPEQIETAKVEWQKRHDAVKEAGGLHIIGTERHESRRIDNQLRGRAGRQGDPGLSRFYLSLEDNLMRIFASERMRGFMQALGMEKGEAIEHKMVTNAIEKAQRKVEGRNFDIRKQLLEYDDVANDQRQVIYNQRNELLESNDISDTIETIFVDVLNDTVDIFVPPQSIEEQWDVPSLEKHIQSEYGVGLPIAKWLEEDTSLHEESLRQKIIDSVQDAYRAKCERIGSVMREVEQQVMLQVLDNHWKEHLQNMTHMRQGVGLRSYAQKNPKQEYKRESFEMFQTLLQNIKQEVVKMVCRVEPVTREQMEAMEQQRREEQARQQARMKMQHDSADAMGENKGTPNKPQTFTREGIKVGRNDACPCGSGKKYKQCCGKLT